MDKKVLILILILAIIIASWFLLPFFKKTVINRQLIDKQKKLGELIKIDLTAPVDSKIIVPSKEVLNRLSSSAKTGVNDLGEVVKKTSGFPE